MEVLDAIFTRRSVRAYTRQPVPQEEIDLILRAGMYSPSAGNTCPWHFVVINDRDTLDEIAAQHSAAHMLLEAPVAILICADTNISKPGRWILDCAAATQNMLLAAHARGLGAVWVGVQPVTERVDLLIRLIGLPNEIQPVSLVSLGYPKGEVEGNIERYDPERVRYNHW